MKPETLVIKRFREGMERYFPRSLLIEKTNNPYKGGILDLYFEAHKFMGWAEVKYKPTKTGIDEKYDPAPVIKLLSAQQMARFEMHVTNETPCALIAGFAGKNSRNRSYAFIEPTSHPRKVISWPRQVRTVDLQILCLHVGEWIDSYEISYGV